MNHSQKITDIFVLILQNGERNFTSFTQQWWPWFRQSVGSMVAKKGTPKPRTRAWLRGLGSAFPKPLRQMPAASLSRHRVSPSWNQGRCWLFQAAQ